MRAGGGVLVPGIRAGLAEPLAFALQVWKMVPGEVAKTAKAEPVSSAQTSGSD